MSGFPIFSNPRATAADDTNVVSGFAAPPNRSGTLQTTLMSCPVWSSLTSDPACTRQQCCFQLKYTGSTTSAAHDLMSCPMENNTASSSIMQSVQIQKPIPTAARNLPRKYPPFFAESCSNAIQKITLIPENKRRIMPRNPKDNVLLFFSQKTIEQYQNKLKTSQNLGKMIPQA